MHFPAHRPGPCFSLDTPQALGLNPCWSPTPLAQLPSLLGYSLCLGTLPTMGYSLRGPGVLPQSPIKGRRAGPPPVACVWVSMALSSPGLLTSPSRRGGSGPPFPSRLSQSLRSASPRPAPAPCGRLAEALAWDSLARLSYPRAGAGLALGPRCRSVQGKETSPGAPARHHQPKKKQAGRCPWVSRKEGASLLQKS